MRIKTLLNKRDNLVITPESQNELNKLNKKIDAYVRRSQLTGKILRIVLVVALCAIPLALSLMFSCWWSLLYILNLVLIIIVKMRLK